MKFAFDFPLLTVKNVIQAAFNHAFETGQQTLRHMSLASNGPRRRTGARWNPSSLFMCLRKQVYKAHKVAAKEVQVGYDDQIVFDRGHMVGSWLAAYARAAEDAGLIHNVRAQCADRTEELSIHPELQVGGFRDVSFEDNLGRRYIWEIKSKATNSAMDKISLDKKHGGQGQIYLHSPGEDGAYADHLIVAYAGLVERNERQGLEIVEYPQERRPEVFSELERRVSQLNWFYEDPTLLAPLSDAMARECPNCPYQHVCMRNLTPAQAVDEGP